LTDNAFALSKACISKIAFKDIPEDPTRDIYLLGATLGDGLQTLAAAEVSPAISFFYQESDEAATADLAVYLCQNEQAFAAYPIFSRANEQGIWRPMLVRVSGLCGAC
jgi:hypothetical protein